MRKFNSLRFIQENEMNDIKHWVPSYLMNITIHELKNKEKKD